ncbi:MAG: hypothetical protein A2341_01955 [Deltaproteobacteria bacterium RIFOXYB12_FULL_58_9]|nr:MAG: hypothetical protein A2341_01955 [Deltaproteobacteria bacterium RIFOXYB12_FULL_58_9]
MNHPTTDKMESKRYFRRIGDAYGWIEQDSSIQFKAVTKEGDPIELTGDEARKIAGLLLDLAKELEINDNNYNK